MVKSIKKYVFRSYLYVISTIILGFFLLAVSNVVANNPPKNRNYSIYIYGETHGEEAISDKELEIWYDFYHKKEMRHLFIEAAYFDAEILNLWMKDDDDYYLDKLFKEWEGTYSDNDVTRNFYVQIKKNCPETIFHGTDIGHQYDTIGEFYLEYLENNGLKNSEKYRLTLESIEQGRQFYSGQGNIMKYREDKMVENFIREYDKLDGEKIMGIYGSAHLKKDILAILFGITPMTDQLKKHYGNIIYAKRLDKI
ncbi:MAG: hypothetical protein ACOX5X_03020 [Acholeplasmataceae bacterium]|jgi:hypothetical protein